MAAIRNGVVVVMNNREALLQLRTHLAMANSEHVVRDQVRIDQLRAEIERVKSLPAEDDYKSLGGNNDG